MTYDQMWRIKATMIFPVREKKRKHIFTRENGDKATLLWDEEKWDYIIECCGQHFESGLSSDEVLLWLENNRFIEPRTGKCVLEVEE